MSYSILGNPSGVELGVLEGPLFVSEESDVEKWLDKYFLGLEFACFYDPDDQSTIIETLPGYPATALTFTIIFSFLSGAGFLIAAALLIYTRFSKYK